MASKMKKTQKSIASGGSLDKKDKHVSSEIKGKLNSSRINGKDHSKSKPPCLIKKTQESGKRKENPDKKDKHVSKENKGGLGNSRSGGEGDCNSNTLSKRSKGCKSGKSNGSLVGKGEHVASKSEGRLGNQRSYHEGDPNLKMPSKMKKTHKSIESDGSLDQKDKHVSSEMKGKLGSGKINGKGHSKTKMPRLVKKTQVSGKGKENLDKKDQHVSTKNKVRLGNRRSGEVDCILRTLSKWKKSCESGKSNGSLDRKEEHVSLKNEGKLGNLRSDDEGDPHLKALSKRKKQRKSRKKNQSLDNKDQHGETDDRICNNRSCEEDDPNSKMPSKVKKTPKSIESDGGLDKKDEHVSSEIKGELGSSRINGKGHSKIKIPRLIKKMQESGKRKENLDKKDRHVSPENKGRLGNGWSGGEGDCNLKTLSKWKKRSESGKSNGSLDGKEEHVSSKDENRLGNSMDQDNAWMNLKKPVGGGTPGRSIGKLFISKKEIAKGSNGTVILEGSFEGRSVAVKRLVRAHHYVASQEIQSLTASDGDPNIVRLYGAECDQDFVYLALERCACSLDGLIRAHSNFPEKSVFPYDPALNAIVKYKMQLGFVEGTMQDVNLWREAGHPSPSLIKLMRDVVSGLVHLHRLGIIHRNLKPQNVLITKELRAKLSDMGISRILPGDTSSSEYHVTDRGRSGLQASEQLCPAQQACSVDVFGLGCVLYFCVTGGRHPFKDSLKGDSNIEEKTVDLSPVEFMPEAADMFARLLNSNPNLRPKALEVLHHPLFWDSSTRLSFLRDISDWFQPKASGGTDSDLLEKLESIAQRVFDEEWDRKIDCEFIKHMNKFRRYEFKSVRDLLRIVRNTFSHCRELPPEIEEIVGSSPEDVDSYFAKRFPKLLIEIYRFGSTWCKDKERSPFPGYFNR